MNSKLLRRRFQKPALMRMSEEIPVQLLAALPFGLEVSSFPDLLWNVAVLLPQLLDDGASERGSPLTLRLSLLSVRIRHVSIFRNGTGFMLRKSGLFLHFIFRQFKLMNPNFTITKPQN